VLLPDADTILFLLFKRLLYFILGGEIILTCRDVEAGGKALARIKEEVKDAMVQLKHLDLSSLKSVHQFVDDLGNGPSHANISSGISTNTHTHAHTHTHIYILPFA
jgi:hypothetical protein